MAEKPKRQKAAGTADETACRSGVALGRAQLGSFSLSTSSMRASVSEKRPRATCPVSPFLAPGLDPFPLPPSPSLPWHPTFLPTRRSADEGYQCLMSFR